MYLRLIIEGDDFLVAVGLPLLEVHVHDVHAAQVRAVGSRRNVVVGFLYAAE